MNRKLPHIKDPLWKGPSVDGVTQSLITKYLQDPYEFYIYAIIGLRHPESYDENLIWGEAFHVGLEHLLRDKNLNKAKMLACKRERELHKETGIKVPYIDHTLPRMLEIYNPGLFDNTNINTEIKLKRTTKYKGCEFIFRGKGDVAGEKQKEEDWLDILGDHKAKGKYLDYSALLKETPHNLQVNLYCWMAEVYTFIYDVIRVPLTPWPTPKKGLKEKPQDYMDNIFKWKSHGEFYPIERNKRHWFYQWDITKTKDQVEKYMLDTVLPITYQMQRWFDHVIEKGPESFNDLHYKKPVRLFDPAYTKNYKSEFYDYRVGDLELEEYNKAELIFGELDGNK